MSFVLDTPQHQLWRLKKTDKTLAINDAPLLHLFLTLYLSLSPWAAIPSCLCLHANLWEGVFNEEQGKDQLVYNGRVLLFLTRLLHCFKCAREENEGWGKGTPA